MARKKKIYDRMDSALDEKLVEILENGIEVPDANGGLRTVPAPASYFNIARQRLNDLGMSRSDDDEATQRLREAMESHKRAVKAGQFPKLADVDIDTDDAATA